MGSFGPWAYAALARIPLTVQARVTVGERTRPVFTTTLVTMKTVQDSSAASEPSLFWTPGSLVGCFVWRPNASSLENVAR